MTAAEFFTRSQVGLDSRGRDLRLSLLSVTSDWGAARKSQLLTRGIPYTWVNMDVLANVSYLQLFWGAQATYVGYKLISNAQSGTFFDRTQGERDPEVKLGLFHFKKR